MIFTVKNIKNTDIINIQNKKYSIFEMALLFKTIIKLAEQKNRHVIINFNQKQVLNNLFIETLMSAQKYCDRTNSVLSLCGMRSDTLCVFYLLKLDKHFEFYENQFDAVIRENRLIRRRLKAV
ncbi:MAG TPA: hypothetical protein P5556_01820 [Candidatus Gastranaerophilales bacterium]|nr:hypothetical protein [Candidatus Gastranaerophilales bacterium]